MAYLFACEGMNREDFGRFVRRERKQTARLSQHKVAALIKSDTTTISRIELGKRNPSLDFILRLADAMKIKPHRFFSDEPLVPKHVAEREPVIIQLNAPNGEFEGIRCFDSPACLGSGFSMDEMQEVGFLPMAKSELPVGYKSEPDRIVCFHTSGLSMVPTIMPDSHIVVDRYVPAEWVVPGGIYAFLLPSGDITIKRLLKLTDDSLIIDADNPDPKERREGSTKDFPMVLSLQEDQSIIRGRVIWILNRLVEKPKK